MRFLLLLTLLSTGVCANTQLQTYARLFGMAPMEAATPKREELYQLGLRLFMDPLLSGNNNISCLMCHTPAIGTGDQLPLSLGAGAHGLGSMRQQGDGAILRRNTPALFNLGVPSARHMFWDTRVTRDAYGHWVTPEPALNGATPQLAEVARTLDSPLAVQALFPIATPEEMLGLGSPLTRTEAWDATLERLLNGPRAHIYQSLFKQAFGEVSYNIGHVGNALAEFQRHAFWAGDTPWDRFLKGEDILSEEMKAGALVFFEQGQCARCHSGMQLSNFETRSIGVPNLTVGSDDKGLFEVTGDPRDLYHFRVAPLRNVALTAPYMHNGVFSTLHEVIEFYDRPMHALRHFAWSEEIPNYNIPLTIEREPQNQMARARMMSHDLTRHLNLTVEQKSQLWCFLTVALTDLNYQDQLQGVENENPRCHPILPGTYRPGR
jgi:cytochrome c peroxidase